jgi:glycosyltransferase involved in cell wall biosynthesis
LNIEHTFSNKLAFIGRIRHRCGLEIIFDAVQPLIKFFPDISVEIIGDGDPDYIEELKKKYKFVNFHGVIYDEKGIAEKLGNCAAGIYGGDAGLSIVHYMSLGLPVILHKEIELHMGPEPYYIKENVNGLLFKRNSVKELTDCIKKILSNHHLRNNLALGALQTFMEMKTPSMAEKFIYLVKE